MKNEDAVYKFLDGATKGKASSVYIDGDKLFNYSTVIAQRINGVIVLNSTRYSSTTTRWQNVLRREMPNAPFVSDIPRGCSDLYPALKREGLKVLAAAEKMTDDELLKALEEGANNQEKAGVEA